jgi:hypothetical protein
MDARLVNAIQPTAIGILKLPVADSPLSLTLASA